MVNVVKKKKKGDVSILLQTPLPSRVPHSIEQSSLCSKEKYGSLGWEDPLEKEMATHSSILAYRNLWTEEHGKLQSIGSQKSQTRLSN